MADIVQLAENGVLKYLKTHFKAVEGLESELAKKENKLKKTGKVSITFAGAVPSQSFPVYYQINGNEFEFGGRCQLPKTTGHIFFILPAGIRPVAQVIREMDFIVNVTTEKMLLEINTDGTCKVYYNSNDAIEVSIDPLHFTIA